jgi:CRISPR-associated protein Csm5
MPSRKEIILSGQYRAFVSEICLLDAKLSPQHPASKKLPILRPNILALVRDCNAYYWTKLLKERRLLRERGLSAGEWLAHLDNLLENIQRDLTNDSAFLIRLGRYGGAESKTFSEHAHIQIRLPNKQHEYRKNTTTLWLAADQDKQEQGLLPFGWALVEIDPQGDNDALLSWCKEESKGRPDMAAIRAKAQAEKDRIGAERAAREKVEAGRRVKEQEAALAREREERELAAMSEERRRLRDFCRKLEARLPLKANEAGAAILTECAAFLESAVSWPEAERKLCVEQVAPLLKTKNMYLGKREKQFKEAMKKLRGPEHG